MRTLRRFNLSAQVVLNFPCDMMRLVVSDTYDKVHNILYEVVILLLSNLQTIEPAGQVFRGGASTPS